jgi:hypothetical protein
MRLALVRVRTTICPARSITLRFRIVEKHAFGLSWTCMHYFYAKVSIDQFCVGLSMC